MRSPSLRVGAHPSDGFDDLVMHLHRGVEDGFVMGDAISEPANGVEATVHEGAFFAAARQEAFIDCFTPKRVVITCSQQADPKRKFQFRDNIARDWLAQLS